MFNLIQILRVDADFKKRWLCCSCVLSLLKVLCIWQYWTFVDDLSKKVFTTVFRPEYVLMYSIDGYSMLTLGFCMLPTTIIESLLLAYLIHVGDELLFRYRSRKAAK
jgi:hypothetical protein